MKFGTVIKCKARVVAHGYSLEEGIDYDETFAPVARMEAIRIFHAYATYMNFKVFQMDVKSTFLNGKIKEEVYVKQPPSFTSSEFPDYVCKHGKALYGLKQEPRAWYETLSTFLIQNKFVRGKIENTLFIFKTKGDVLLDDKGNSICQEKCRRDLLKKYEISDISSVKTPIVPPNNLGLDLSSKPINETLYIGMIGSLMYLTASRPDIQFSTCLCARYQANPNESHLIAVKRIFRYIKGTPTFGFWCMSIAWRKVSVLECKEIGDIVAMSSAKAEYVDLKDQHHPLRTGTTIPKRMEVAMPQTEAVKAELLKLGLHKERNEAEMPNVFVNKTPLFKTWFPMVLTEGTTTDPKESRRNTELTDMGFPSTLFTNLSRASTRYQVDKTQYTRFEVSDPDQNKGKTSFEVDLDKLPPIQSFEDYKLFIEDLEDNLKELSDEEIFEVGDEMEDAFPMNIEEESQPPPSTNKFSPSELSQPEEPTHFES
ncbi:retrovirus-related pol polyprotein from transposon TNT 1-94 [Tanacetum coccineum]